MTAFFLVVFLVSTAIHLYASLKQNTRLRNYTKPILLASLFGFYYVTARGVLPAILLALFFSWLGDVLLMPKGVKWFTAGGIAFMVSHIFFILGYCTDIDFALLHPLIIVPLALIFVGLVAFIFSKLKPHLPKMLFYPMFFYLLINGSMNCFAIFRMISKPCTATIITCIGAVLFFISDSTLFFVRFKKDGRLKTHFWVMLTYSIGELLIIIGLL
ncbi:MAG: lysoplasmalogenase [Lachnospiraceae bacterium]|nr:lysoplasmalogenase [Lachnospiraceae bacterium]